VTRVALLVALAALTVGCRMPRCEDLQPAPIEGKYRGGGTLGEERLLRVVVEASAKQVSFSYTTMDGSRVRAKYTITKKRKEP
jgi:hypothetical protein